MPNPVNLVVLYGGKSGEHEVSLVSAASVLLNLDSTQYNIIPVAMDKDGQFHLHRYEDLRACTDKLPVVSEHSVPLPNFFVGGQLFTDVDVVFPVVHGPLYEDGCLQGLLELANVAYVGCGPLSAALSMDKDMSRRIACIDGVQSARYLTLSSLTGTKEKQDFCQKVATEFGWPVFVKPCSLGSSVGIHKAKNMAELEAAVTDAMRYDREIIVEQAVYGREIELAVLENADHTKPPKVSIAGEIKVNHPDGFYSYTAKYLESHYTDLLVPAKLDASMLQTLQKLSAQIFVRLKCKGMARVDFFVDDSNNQIYFNEVNTIPGFTSISMYPKLWQASGLSYMQLLDELVALALADKQIKQQLVTNYL